MKKCKHCQSEIDDKAKICPNCRKKQGMPVWLIVILVIVGISVLGSAFGGDSSSDENKPSGSTNPKEELVLLDGHKGQRDGDYTYEVIGSIKNNTDKEYSYVAVEFYAYDADGNMLDTCIANNSGLEANGTWKFRASCWLTDGNAKQVKSYKLKEITGW